MLYLQLVQVHWIGPHLHLILRCIYRQEPRLRVSYIYGTFGALWGLRVVISMSQFS